MKKFFTVCVSILFIIYISSIVYSMRNPYLYLKGLYKKNNQVIQVLHSEDIEATYEHILESFIINDGDVKYKFSESGNVEAPYNYVNIIIENKGRKGLNTSKIDIYLGEPREFKRNIYYLSNLDKPKAFRILWSDKKEIDTMIKKEISNDQIIKIVNKADEYQKKIKSILDTN